jgi:hypothetical protein
MPDDEGAGILGAALAPLLLPRRALRDLEAIGAAARGLPTFERVLLERLEDFGDDVRDVTDELNAAVERVMEELRQLDARVAVLQASVPELSRELLATKVHVSDLKSQVGYAVEHLPDPNSRGPIARARDAITGNSEPSDDG